MCDINLGNQLSNHYFMRKRLYKIKIKKLNSIFKIIKTHIMEYEELYNIKQQHFNIIFHVNNLISIRYAKEN